MPTFPAALGVNRPPEWLATPAASPSDHTQPPTGHNEGHAALFAAWSDPFPEQHVNAIRDTAFSTWTAYKPTNTHPRSTCDQTIRSRRNSDFTDQAPHKASDLASLLRARIAGTRAVLKENSGDDDNTLLLAAYAIHHKAIQHPHDANTQSASQALWRAEAAAWASANGADPTLDKETQLQAYVDLWSLALDRPLAPNFDDRREIAKRYVLERARAGLSIAIADKPSPVPIPVDTLIEHYMNDPEVISRYYNQFASYVESHLARFSKLVIIGEASAIGINRLRLEEKPRRMWHIKGLPQLPAGSHEVPPGSAPSVVSRRLGESHVVEMQNGEFFHIDATGSLHKIDGKVVDEAGRLKISTVFKSRSISQNTTIDKFAAPPGSEGSTKGASTANQPPHPHEYQMISEPVHLMEHLLALRQDAIRAMIKQWKEKKYLPLHPESILWRRVPFYKASHYRLQ
jgi:hypothetical protein